MGQEIVYCSKCAERLLGSDFDKGRAFRVGDMSVCLKCARELLPTFSPLDRQVLMEKFKELDLKKSSGSFPALRSSSTQVPTVSSSSTQMKAARSSSAGFPSVKAPIPAEVPRASSKIVLGAVVGVVLLILIIMALMGDRSRSRMPARPEEPA
ncbi:MAG TPA: hypothetical protein VEN81_16030, partial [Planctomycetota bacterium]|nr:hypothetical protein [Planctomycetota bacterium]